MTVRSETRGRTALVTIDRPERRNALDPATVDALVDALDAAFAATDVHAVVLTATGDRAFCAGMDLSSVGSADQGPRPGRVRYLELIRSGGTKPMVAAVNGAAVAGGLELALACDLVIAADHARFALPEVSRGLIPGAGGTLLPQRIPVALARELALTGGFVSAQWALDAGLVNRVVPGTEMLDVALDLADQIAANSPWAVRHTRRLLASVHGTHAADLWAEIDEATAVAIAGPHAREGSRAFLEKRAPAWPTDPD